MHSAVQLKRRSGLEAQTERRRCGRGLPKWRGREYDRGRCWRGGAKFKHHDCQIAHQGDGMMVWWDGSGPGRRNHGTGLDDKHVGSVLRVLNGA
jgi:hypothetical protein